ncbi:MAG: hypothetical protein Q8L52_03260 [bacterium]|nr:hypothetical protein [bacterium]
MNTKRNRKNLGVYKNVRKESQPPVFHPETAPIAALLERGFTGKVIKLGEPNGKPTVVVFTAGEQKVERTFPRGLCEPLEDEFLADPSRMSLRELLENEFVGKVLALGEVGGKPTLVKFRDSAGQEVTRTFPRGMCLGLEQGFVARQGVRLRAPARRRI